MRMKMSSLFLSLAAVAGLTSGAAEAATFNVANTTDAGSFGTITGQGFSATSTSGDPGVGSGAGVFLREFRFFKGAAGVASASNLSLVLFNTSYPDLNTPASAAATLVGTSTNVIAGGTSFASGDALTFSFANLPITYGNNYAVGLFSGVPSAATAVQISALTANYVESPAGSGTFVPVTNYGSANNFSASAYFGVQGNGFYSAYGSAGDTNFFATLATDVPEPVTGLALAGAVLLAARRRRA